MFTVERTHEPAIIKRLATDPSIFPFVSDDYCDDAQKWQPLMGDFVFNLIGKDRWGAFGFGIFICRSHSCADAHIGFLPRSYGETALSAFCIMLEWMWSRTSIARIVGEVCVENHRAIAFSKRAGFTAYGLNVRSKLKGGVLRDQVCLGISKP